MQQVIRHPNFIELITEVSLVELGTIFLRLKKFIHTGSNHAFYLLENPQFLFFLKEYFGGKVRRTESMEERLHTLDFLLEIITRNYVTEEELGFKIEEMIATQRPEYKSVLNSFPKTEEEKIEKKRLQRTLRHQVSMKSELEVRKYILQNTSDKEKRKRKRLHYCEEVVAGWEEDPRHPLAFLDTTMGYELEHILRQIDEHFPQLIYQVLDALNIYQFGSTDHELGPGPYRSPKAAALTFERMNDAGLLETMGNFYISSHMNIGVKSRNTMLQIIQGVRYAGHFNPSVNLDKINPKSSRVGNTMVRENSQIGIPYWESKKPQLITTQEFIRSLLVTGYLAQAGSAYEFFEFRSLFPAKNKSRPAQIQLHDVWKSYLKRMQDGLEVIGTPNALSIKLSISEDLKLMSHNSQVYPSFYHRLLGRDRLNQRYSHLPNASKTEFDSQIVVNGLTYQNSVQYFDAVVNETCSEILRIRKEESEVAHQMLNAMEQLFRVPTHNQTELKEKNLKMSVLLNDYKERFSLEISASNELEMQATENSCQFYKKRLRPVRGRMMKANTLELELWQSTG